MSSSDAPPRDALIGSSIALMTLLNRILYGPGIYGSELERLMTNTKRLVAEAMKAQPDAGRAAFESSIHQTLMAAGQDPDRIIEMTDEILASDEIATTFGNGCGCPFCTQIRAITSRNT